MPIGRFLLTFLALAGLLMAGGVSVFCMPAGHGAMACCKTVQPCAPGIKVADCCRFVPVSQGNPPAGVATSLVSKISRDQGKEVLFAAASWSADPVLSAFNGESPPFLLPPEASVPIFLRNTSLLR